MKRHLLIYILALLLATNIGCKDEVLLSTHSSINVSPDSQAETTLKVGNSVLLNNELQITFVGVGLDSRCPVDVICVWEGDAEVKLKLKKGSLEKYVMLHTSLSPRSFVFDGYEINLSEVLPLTKSDQQIKQEQYSIKLKIKYQVNSEKKQIHFIDSSTDWVLKKDLLTVNSASIEKDELLVSVSYGGGCANHFIELYSYTGILKSNPPQMNLVLSHNANNDMCEAYITKNFRFDLNAIKKYLGAQVGGTGTVILNIAGTDGKPIKPSPVAYKY